MKSKQKGIGDVVLLGVLVVLFTFFRAEIHEKTQTEDVQVTQEQQ